MHLRFPNGVFQTGEKDLLLILHTLSAAAVADFLLRFASVRPSVLQTPRKVRNSPFYEPRMALW